MNRTLPKYLQIQESIASWISSADFKPGEMIPSERELCEQFGVSRMTVRQAISNLVTTGALRRVQGLGTFIAEPKNEYDIGLLVSYTQSVLRRGKRPSGKLLQFDQIIADDKIAQLLSVNLGQKLYHLVRIRFSDNEPMVLESCYFPYDRCPGIEKFDVENESIYRIWREEYGITFGKIRQSLEPGLASEFEANAFGIPPGSLLMLVERISYDILGVPVEYAHDVHRGENSRFVAELTIDN